MSRTPAGLLFTDCTAQSIRWSIEDTRNMLDAGYWRTQEERAAARQSLSDMINYLPEVNLAEHENGLHNATDEPGCVHCTAEPVERA